MRAYIVCTTILAWTLLGLDTVHGQTLYYTVPDPAQEVLGPEVAEEAAPPSSSPEVPLRLGPSDYVLGRQPNGCCGPVGGNGPIQTEFYLRSGLSFPFGDGVYGKNLDTGWLIQGGGRALFYNPPRNAAWIWDMHIINTFNPMQNLNTRVKLNIIVPTPTGGTFTGGGAERVTFGEGAVPPVTLRDLNRVRVGMGFGRLWHIVEPTETNPWGWRLGFDGGGRYGTAGAQFLEIRHRSDNIWDAYVGLQSDALYRCGCWTFLGGVRVEYDHTWNQILQEQNNAEVNDINLMFNLGVQY